VQADEHWEEVLKLAEKHGFIVQASGGVAMLATHAVQKEQFGEEGYCQIQKMNGREVS
jgi:cysteine synthase